MKVQGSIKIEFGETRLEMTIEEAQDLLNKLQALVMPKPVVTYPSLPLLINEPYIITCTDGTENER